MPIIDIPKNLLNIRERIKKAAMKCNRNPEDVHLVAVSKTISPETIKIAIDAGATILGENYIQEARKKIEILGQKISWHFIGHLQTNKAKYAVDLFDMIHSVDSFHVAERLNRECQKKNRIIPILIQVNISSEDTKYGVDPQRIFKLIKDISELQYIRLQGLMTMPPWSTDPENSRPYYISLRKLRDDLDALGLENVCLKELSMGMSSDFEVAIEEGATLIRVGTSIFGARH
jgi:pyridoxal phosphate enzyme (YggS family)